MKGCSLFNAKYYLCNRNSERSLVIQNNELSRISLISKSLPIQPVFNRRVFCFKHLAQYHIFIIGEVISGKGGTSSTWYNYQKLINFIREYGKLDSPVNTTHIDFYKDCFITELNELCRLNNHRLSAEERRKIEENIRNRFDLMIATNSFWSHFKTVILACGPYADALRADPRLTRAIFGCAKVISSVNGKKIPQLSFAISNDLLREIAKQV